MPEIRNRHVPPPGAETVPDGEYRLDYVKQL
jgi:hypothetical protein